MSSLLERAVSAARQDQPSRLDAADAARMLAVARWHAKQPAAPARRWRMVIGGVAVAAAALALWLVAQRGTQREHEPTELTLSTGDRITTTPGARLHVTAEGPARAVEITAGTALFDVRPLRQGEHFVVRTRDSAVRVVGTVFTVQATATGTIVRVYEGHVQVDRGTASYAVHRGSQLAADGTVQAISGDLLADQGRARAREREYRAAMEGSRDEATHAAPASAAPSQPPSSAPSQPPSSVATGTTRTRETPAVPARRPPPTAKSTNVAAVTAVEAPQPAEAIALLSDGKFERARDLAAANDWPIIEGDAQRALHAYKEAAAAYERASVAGSDACLGALLAARVHAEQLGDAGRALEMLAVASRADCEMRERALALTMDIGTRAKRHDVAMQAARAYLASFPHGNRAGVARALIDAE